MSEERLANGEGSGSQGEHTISAAALKLLRDFSGLTQGDLGDRSGVGGRTVGKYERGEQELKVDDLHRMLEAMDLPPRAWSYMLRVVERLGWLRTRHVGTRSEIVDGEAGVGTSLIVDAEGRFDWTGVRRELAHVAEDAGHNRERELADLLELLIALFRARK